MKPIDKLTDTKKVDKSFFLDKSKKTKTKKPWQIHEPKVTDDLIANGKQGGTQITLDVEGVNTKGESFKTTIMVDNLHKRPDGSWQITDAKHSLKKDLTDDSINLRNTFTKNQKEAYDAIGGKVGENGIKANVTSIKPRGENARKIKGLELGEEIKINNKIDIAVNNPYGEIIYKTYP